MDGILLIDKDPGKTSHDIVAEVRFALGERHAGHTGTLDPAATGLLVVALGKACRLMPYMEDHHKEYVFTLKLGVRTDTDDLEGKVLEERDASAVSREAVESTLARMTGRILQRPPAYSAVRVGGKRAYQLARRGESVEVPSREVEIDELRLTSWDPPLSGVFMRCSKGTYVRAVARDLGEALGVGGAVQELRRTAVGPFRVEQAMRLSEASGEDLRRAVLPTDSGIQALPRMDLVGDEGRKFANGQRIDLPLAGKAARVYHEGRFLGIGEEKAGGLKARAVIGSLL